MVDPIADMLTRIRNAQAVQKETVEVPFSQTKFALAKILERRGFVGAVDFKGKKLKKTIEINLKYNNEGAKITGLKRISKPGQRVYSSVQDLKRVRGGQGMAILSTSKGLMTDQDAKKENMGGEILCEIW